MATQTGLTIAAPNEPYIISSDIPRPKPGPKQVLIKSLFVGVNPMEPLMHHTGLLITSWPAVIGCEASGVVVEVGEGVKRLKKGDYVLGCTRTGTPGHSTYQETFLMSEDTAIRQGTKLTPENASTIGVGLYTAALGLLAGLKLKLPAPGAQAEEKDEWVIIYGASGSVGQFGIQLARLAGYKVLASSSPAKNDVCKANGATAHVNHKLSEVEQLKEIQHVTGGNFNKIFDSSALAYDVSIKALDAVSTGQEKFFASTDDWSQWPKLPSTSVYRIELGHIDREDDPLGVEVSRDIASWVEILEGHLETGALKPLDYHLFDGVGWQALADAVAFFEAGKSPKKLVVKIQDP